MVTKSNYVSDVISSLLLSYAEWVTVLCDLLSKRFRVSKAPEPILPNLLPQTELLSFAQAAYDI